MFGENIIFVFYYAVVIQTELRGSAPVKRCETVRTRYLCRYWISDHAVFCRRYYTYPPIILWSGISDQWNYTLSVTVFPLEVCTPSFQGKSLHWKKWQDAYPARESSTGWSVLLGAAIRDVPYFAQVNISWVKQHGLITTHTLQWLNDWPMKRFIFFILKKSRDLIGSYNFCPLEFFCVGEMVCLGLFSCLLVVCLFARDCAFAYVFFFITISKNNIYLAFAFPHTIFAELFAKLEQN